MSDTIRVAVIGLGEAGCLIAGGLHDAGLDVVGFDPAPVVAPPLPVAESVADAICGADLVISINSSTVALEVAEQIAQLLEPGAVFADLNTGTPALKRKLATLFPSEVFVDVAIMKPVPGLAEKVPMCVSGPGARRFVELLRPFQLNLEYVSEVPGDAAARKLVRSILAKGMAAVLIDCLWAAESMSIQDWAYSEILHEFDSSSAELAKRYLTGTAQHFKRRQVEMMDVADMLREVGYQSTMVDGVASTYSRISQGKVVPFSIPSS